LHLGLKQYPQKIQVSSKSRFRAYLAAAQHKKDQEEEREKETEKQEEKEKEKEEERSEDKEKSGGERETEG
jgi:ribosomal protein L12E/L44/L45/RPP1/RPP2